MRRTKLGKLEHLTCDFKPIKNRGKNTALAFFFKKNLLFVLLKRLLDCLKVPFASLFLTIFFNHQ